MKKHASKVPLPIQKKEQKNKELLDKYLNEVRSNEELKPKQMEEALEKIAEELHKYQSSDTSIEILSEEKYKSKLKIKKQQIKNLKENLHTACTVAKALTTSNKTKYNLLSQHLCSIQNGNEQLQKEITQKEETIKKLEAEKQAISSKFQNLKIFIELGYKELLKVRKEEEKQLPPELQLKEIIVSCGQFYADLHNEHDKCVLLEQKNRFLVNKLSILERNLESASMESLHRKSSGNEKKNNNDRIIGYGHTQENRSWKIMKSVEGLPVVNVSLDLTKHMKLVSGLLKEQDGMLGELKKLSDELSCLES